MDLVSLEERMAHLLRALDDLSDVVARQDREIAWLRARVATLLEREADRDAETARAASTAPPPHW